MKKKRVMLDTNILISAIVFDGKIEKLLNALKKCDMQLLVSDYVEKEFRAKVDKKWAVKADDYKRVFEKFEFTRCPSTDEILTTLRDEKDIPVLSDAIFHDADILLTGDKDFFESNIKKSLIISPAILFEYLSAD